MMKGNLMVDDNMSNLTFASGEISASSSTRNDQSVGNLYPQNSAASTNQLPPPPNKKKRSLPGNPGLSAFFFPPTHVHIYIYMCFANNIVHIIDNSINIIVIMFLGF